jgi:hypothetical protein
MATGVQTNISNTIRRNVEKEGQTHPPNDAAAEENTARSILLLLLEA